MGSFPPYYGFEMSTNHPGVAYCPTYRALASRRFTPSSDRGSSVVWCRDLTWATTRGQEARLEVN